MHKLGEFIHDKVNIRLSHPDLGRGNQHRVELSSSEDTALSRRRIQVDHTQIGEM